MRQYANDKNDYGDYDDEDGEGDDDSSSSDAASRWDPNVLNKLDVKLVDVDDAKENLPDFYDTRRIQKEKKSQKCQICRVNFNKIK